MSKIKIKKGIEAGRFRFLTLREVEDRSRNEKMLRVVREEASKEKPRTIIPYWDKEKRMVRFFGVNQICAE